MEVYTTEFEDKLLEIRRKLENIKDLDNHYLSLNKLLIKHVNRLINNKDSWERDVKVRLNELKEILINNNYLYNYTKTNDEEFILEILLITFPILFEFNLKLVVKNKEANGIDEIRNIVRLNIEKYPLDFKARIYYMLHELPLKILRDDYGRIYRHINELKEKQESFKDVENKIFEEANYLKEWEQKQDERQQRLDDLESFLKENVSNYNYVALSKGFQDVKTQLSKRSSNLLSILTCLSILIIVILFFEYYNIRSSFQSIENINSIEQSYKDLKEDLKGDSISNNSLELQKLYSKRIVATQRRIDSQLIKSLITAIPIISGIIILLYIFRIILYNYKITRTELIQVELRITLCRFIQSYADKSGEIKEKSPGTLGNFERVIFSDLVSDTEKLPTTIDGIEKISTIIKNMK
ncbi:hypothetical protein MY04_2200 [Flammeovirga sp. MY04]|uniref:hypothetical protein n=1 Tax=Flammeovirga sp. MY04 TaxID=1191459 RepID=UPI0008060B07|nr:hypothetical protein [Flammeovirga sp. MY04]ANQ49574.1 hypothetical protein MY04_2200 [Flammeovirga sp. MY04]